MGNCLSSCNGSKPNVSNPQPQLPTPPDLAKKPPRPTERLQLDQQLVPTPEIPENCTQDKQVVVHETLRDEIQNTDKPLKENRDVNLLEPVKASRRREFCGKPVNGIETKRQYGCRKVPVKRQSPEENRIQPRPARRGIEPATSRRSESTLSPRIDPVTSRRSESMRSPRIEPATSRRFETTESKRGSRRIPVKKQNSGEFSAGASSMRSGSFSFRTAKGSGRDCGDSQNVLRRTNSCRRSRLKEQISAVEVLEEAHQSKGENSSCFETEQVVEVEEKPKSVCEVPTENATPSEVQCGSNLPPIDLENPLISLDCFIFL